jgi:hypothetical protein
VNLDVHGPRHARNITDRLPVFYAGGDGWGGFAIAAILFVLWLLFHATGALVNLIWLAIIVLVVIWLIGFVRGRSTTS